MPVELRIAGLERWDGGTYGPDFASFKAEYQKRLQESRARIRKLRIAARERGRACPIEIMQAAAEVYVYGQVVGLNQTELTREVDAAMAGLSTVACAQEYRGTRFPSWATIRASLLSWMVGGPSKVAVPPPNPPAAKSQPGASAPTSRSRSAASQATTSPATCRHFCDSENPRGWDPGQASDIIRSHARTLATLLVLQRSGVPLDSVGRQHVRNITAYRSMICEMRKEYLQRWGAQELADLDRHAATDCDPENLWAFSYRDRSLAVDAASCKAGFVLHCGATR